MADIKLSDEQFLSILRENGGLFARTAQAIGEQFGIKYSRQAVRQRALDHPEEIADIDEENIDIAESGLMTLAQSKSEPIKLKACEIILKTKGKKRGYVERQELDHMGSVAITWQENKTYESPIPERVTMVSEISQIPNRD